jgi:hypothetical protein
MKRDPERERSVEAAMAQTGASLKGTLRIAARPEDGDKKSDRQRRRRSLEGEKTFAMSSRDADCWRTASFTRWMCCSS